MTNPDERDEPGEGREPLRADGASGGAHTNGLADDGAEEHPAAGGSGVARSDVGGSDAGVGQAPNVEDDPDSLEGYQTFTQRMVGRLRGWVAVVVVAGLLLPAAGWALNEFAFGAAGDRVISELGDEAGLAEAVYLVQSTSCAGVSSSGSAFVMDLEGEPVVVTNRHVVDQARTIGVRPLDGGAAQAVSQYFVADSADVAVLELAEVDDTMRLAAGSDPAIDDPVRAVGFPSARPFTNEGAVADVGSSRMTLDLAVDPGASGSPVMDEAGRVVGQIYARTVDGRGIATPISAVISAIETANPAPPC